ITSHHHHQELPPYHHPSSTPESSQIGSGSPEIDDASRRRPRPGPRAGAWARLPRQPHVLHHHHLLLPGLHIPRAASVPGPRGAWSTPAPASSPPRAATRTTAAAMEPAAARILGCPRTSPPSSRSASRRTARSTLSRIRRWRTGWDCGRGRWRCGSITAALEPSSSRRRWTAST
uniref:Uncharacterized protein n=1 Tax=Triticum urartu TaxID=4572 RepID=A0A8R7V0J2_TRIUA